MPRKAKREGGSEPFEGERAQTKERRARARDFMQRVTDAIDDSP